MIFHADTVDKADPSDVRKSVKRSDSDPRGPAMGNPLLLGLLFGIVFGFLLQKGGVAKFHVLIGQLLLVDFTVLKVMMSAVVVGMLGIHTLRHFGLVKLHIKPTRYLANTLGGLIFGVGFALAAYCPGTGAAAVGQGNLDALPMIAGMLAGSWLYAEASAWIARRIHPIGDKGKTTLIDWIPIGRPAVIASAVTLIILLLTIVEFVALR